MKYQPEWGSHLPVIVKIFELSRGEVLELGMGPFSTPILHWLAFDGQRQLVSYENSREYIEMHKNFENEFHKINFTDDWKKIDINRHWGMAFVDVSPAKARKKLIMDLIDKADFVVVHDSEPESERWHRYQDVFKLFKYRFDYKRAKPWTTILSNLYQIKL